MKSDKTVPDEAPMAGSAAEPAPGALPSDASAQVARKPRGDVSWITQGTIPSAVWRLALPSWGAFLSHDLMGMVDMFFVGKLGPSALASVAMSTAMFGIIIMLAHGVTAGTTALVAVAFGSGKAERAGEVSGQSLTMALVLSAVVAAAGVPFAPQIIRALGAEPDVVAGGSAYLRIVSGGALTMMLMVAFSASLRGAGDASSPFKAMVLSNAVNVVLDPILIFGLGGIPALGVAGSAWATVISRALGVLVMIHVFFVSDRGLVQLHLRDLRPDLPVMARILRIGVFASGRMLVRNISGIILMRLVAAFGTPAVAAYGIGFRLQMLVFGPTMGFGTAAATMVGQNLGAGQPDRAARAGWGAAGMAMAVVACISAALWMAAAAVVGVFNDDPRVVEIGVVCLRWLSASFIFVALGMVLSLAMNGAGDTLRPMIITGLSLLAVGVPLAWWLSSVWESVEGVWVALFLSNLLTGLLAAAAWRKGWWRTSGLRHTGG